MGIGHLIILSLFSRLKEGGMYYPYGLTLPIEFVPYQEKINAIINKYVTGDFIHSGREEALFNMAAKAPLNTDFVEKEDSFAFGVACTRCTPFEKVTEPEERIFSLLAEIHCLNVEMADHSLNAIRREATRETVVPFFSLNKVVTMFDSAYLGMKRSKLEARRTKLLTILKKEIRQLSNV